jgi:hypothetical protein
MSGLVIYSLHHGRGAVGVGALSALLWTQGILRGALRLASFQGHWHGTLEKTSDSCAKLTTI